MHALAVSGVRNLDVFGGVAVAGGAVVDMYNLEKGRNDEEVVPRREKVTEGVISVKADAVPAVTKRMNLVVLSPIVSDRSTKNGCRNFKLFSGRIFNGMDDTALENQARSCSLTAR